MEALDRHMNARLGPSAFSLKLSDAARGFLLDRGTSQEYGARELKRILHRYLIQPLARLVLRKLVDPGAPIRIDAARGADELTFYSKSGRELAA